MTDFNAELGCERKAEERYKGTGERTTGIIDWLKNETNKRFVGDIWFQKKAGKKWTWVAPNTRSENKIDYVLSDDDNAL